METVSIVQRKYLQEELKAALRHLNAGLDRLLETNSFIGDGDNDFFLTNVSIGIEKLQRILMHLLGRADMHLNYQSEGSFVKRQHIITYYISVNILQDSLYLLQCLDALVEDSHLLTTTIALRTYMKKIMEESHIYYWTVEDLKGILSKSVTDICDEYLGAISMILSNE